MPFLTIFQFFPTDLKELQRHDLILFLFSISSTPCLSVYASVIIIFRLLNKASSFCTSRFLHMLNFHSPNSLLSHDLQSYSPSYTDVSVEYCFPHEVFPDSSLRLGLTLRWFNPLGPIIFSIMIIFMIIVYLFVLILH